MLSLLARQVYLADVPCLDACPLEGEGQEVKDLRRVVPEVGYEEVPLGQLQAFQNKKKTISERN